MTLTLHKTARIFAACCTPARALRAAERCRTLGYASLADALTAHAGGLRAVGYPRAQEAYRRQRDLALGVEL